MICKREELRVAIARGKAKLVEIENLKQSMSGFGWIVTILTFQSVRNAQKQIKRAEAFLEFQQTMEEITKQLNASLATKLETPDDI